MKNSENQQLVSIYIPSKNRSTLLKRAIESVLNQDYGNWELVIVDDGSTDETPQLLETYQKDHDKVRFYRNDQSMGIAAARNLAIEQSTGEFVTGLDDDDYFAPNRLSSLMASYDDEFAFVCSSVIWDFGNRKKVADRKQMVINLDQQLSYNHATTQVLVKRERLLSIGGFDANLVARLDYDAWTRLMIHYGSALRINQPTYILNRCADVERATSSDRNITGNHQFLEKHRERMNSKNLTNRAFWDIYAQNKSLGVLELLHQLYAGYAIIKLKYFIRRIFFGR